LLEFTIRNIINIKILYLTIADPYSSVGSSSTSLTISSFSSHLPVAAKNHPYNNWMQQVKNEEKVE
jgi:hypothetical protein